MRLAAYAGASVALATGVVMKALHQRANFYSACVYLSQSSANLMILTNVCLLAVGFLLFWLQRLLYGPLRPIETEQLYEKAWFAVTETCLAMTIFRGELGAWFLVMFVSLLVGKVWGWIGEGRVEFLEQQPPANPVLFHARLAISLLLSVLFNTFMLKYCTETVLEQARPDMMVMFGFEFAVLAILSTSTAVRYTISLVEIFVNRQQMNARVEERRQEIRATRARAEAEQAESGDPTTPPDLPDENDINEMELDIPGWEEKGRWVFYLDLLTDFLKLTVYLTFFAILFTFYGLPIHILRDVVVTIRSFARRIMDFVRYRNATRDMNDRYPDATAEEVTREEVCIICREEMNHWQNQPGERATTSVSERLRPKKLPCGHILHFSCLRSWLERQQNCPTCRRPVIAPPRTQGAAANNPEQANAGAGQQQNAMPGNQPFGRNGAAEVLPRARIYQFGPFRIGFGAGRGDLFNNLHQQIHQGNAPWPQANNPNPAGARQIGFGFGFGRPPPPQLAPAAAQAPPTPTSNVLNMQSHILQLEQQIMAEINSLRVTADQLNLVRLLQTELQRLRALQLQPPDVPNTVLQTPTVPTTTLPSTSPTTVRHQFVSDPGAPSLEAGDSRLPEGLTLPQGWTLVPLHSTQPGLSGPLSDFVTSPVVPTSGNTSNTQIPTETLTEELSITNNAATSPSPRPPGLPNWQSGSNSLTSDANAESLSQQWTDSSAETETARKSAPSSSDQIETRSRQNGDFTTENEASESPSKGKARMATVEDVADDET
ncbi:hypothetical protein BJY00DRAFT_115942 [Aspergillus carlsbadensis]|nr:hypothetical protein BJY00DRAFT_115942 [Aspergillus carlsbadensis]